VYLKEDVFRLPCWISPLDYLDVTSELHIRLFRNAGSDFILALWATSIINNDFSAPPNPLHLTLTSQHPLVGTWTWFHSTLLSVIVRDLYSVSSFCVSVDTLLFCCTFWWEHFYTSVKFGYRYRYKGGLMFGACQRSSCKIVTLMFLSWKRMDTVQIQWQEYSQVHVVIESVCWFL